MGKREDKVERILSLLPATKPQLQARFPMGVATAWRWMDRLHDEQRVHISGWIRAECDCENEGKRVAIYAAGPGKDARKPDVLSPAKREKRRKPQRNAKARSNYWVKRLNEGQVSQDPLTQALFAPALEPVE